MKKDIEWLKKEFDEVVEFRKQSNPSTSWGLGSNAVLKYIKEDFKDLINQLDEPEITLDKAFEKVAESYLMTKEEIWRHLERLEAHGGKVTYDEPETVADVIADFYKSLERLKEVMSMEVKELEE